MEDTWRLPVPKASSAPEKPIRAATISTSRGNNSNSFDCSRNAIIRSAICHQQCRATKTPGRVHTRNKRAESQQCQQSEAGGVDVQHFSHKLQENQQRANSALASRSAASGRACRGRVSSRRQCRCRQTQTASSMQTVAWPCGAIPVYAIPPRASTSIARCGTLLSPRGRDIAGCGEASVSSRGLPFPVIPCPPLLARKR